MALEYVKLAHVTVMTAAITSGDTIVVNLKGLMLTAAEVAQHLAGTIDGEALAARR
jgi:uncharacterized membrane protein YecN with MAPEG domain